MLAAASSAGITLITSKSMKNLPQELPLTILTEACPSSVAWSPDNSHLLFVHGQQVYRSSTDRQPEADICHIDHGDEKISHIVCPTPSSAIYTAGHCITFITHAPFKVDSSIEAKHPITSISLSTDATLLLYTTATSAHALPLSTKSPTPLRGLTLSKNAEILACTIHPHIRGRALITVGRSLLVYDIGRPSAPIKTIGTGGNEALAFVACSPFSGTLVATGTSSGVVHLLDLEKEKSLIRTMNMGTPLACISFSADGGSLYAGTTDGRLLVQKLRDLGSSPQSCIIDPSGGPVIALWTQRKTRPSPNLSAVGVTSSSSSQTSRTSTPLTVKTSRPGPSMSAAASQESATSLPSRSRRISSVPSHPKPTPPRPSTLRQASVTQPSALTPIRDPLQNARTSSKPTLPAAKPLRSARSGLIATTEASSQPHQRVDSSASQAPRRALKLKPKAEEPTKSPPAPRNRSPAQATTLAPSKTSTPGASQSSSPDLPTVRANPTTPLPRRNLAGLQRTLSPVANGKSPQADKERAVAFASDDDEDDKALQAPRIEEASGDEPTVPTLVPPFDALQVTPAKPKASWPMPSPLRNAGLGTLPGGSPNGNAQELLCSLFADALADALTDVRAETTRGIQGLHLDLIRAGRSWRNELKDSLGGVQSELQELREENARLREENERLRKGY